MQKYKKEKNYYDKLFVTVTKYWLIKLNLTLLRIENLKLNRKPFSKRGIKALKSKA